MEGIIFVGLQASGKSSFFLEKFYETHIRLNMDMLKTRHREKILLNACIEGKQKTVIDNTNPTTVERAKYINLFKQGKFKVTGYYFQSRIEECIKRNNQRSGPKAVPETAIRGTYNKMKIPDFDEGFDDLFYVSIENNQFNVNPWDNEIYQS